MGCCHWCPPGVASMPLVLLPSIFSLLLLLVLLSLLRGHFFLLPLPVVVSDTRCCCAAAVLCWCCRDSPIFSSFCRQEPSPPRLPGSPTFPFRSAKLQTVPAFYIVVSSSRKYASLLIWWRSPRGKGVETHDSSSSCFPCPPPLPPFPIPATVRG